MVNLREHKPPAMATTSLWFGKYDAYTYFVHKLSTRFNPFQYGNFVVARKKGDHWEPLFIGEGDLNEQLDNLKQTVKLKKLGATHIHAHVNGMTEYRRAEKEDLLIRYPSAELGAQDG